VQGVLSWFFKHLFGDAAAITAANLAAETVSGATITVAETLVAAAAKG
jgi:hypothetical protein